jgi:AraC-like DNA-binding protein
LKVFTLLPPDAVARIAGAVGSGTSLVRAKDDVTLLDAIRGIFRATVVIDPCLLSGTSLNTVVDALSSVEAYVIVFTSLTPEGIRAVLPFVRSRAAEVVLRGYDDDRARLQHLLSGADRMTVAEQLLHELRDALAMLPLSLQESVTSMFVNDDAVDSTKRLAAASHMTRRSLDRWLSRSGIVSARHLVAAPKILRAYTYLRNTDVSVARAAARLGFSSSRPLEQYCQALLGLEASALCRDVTADELILRMVERLLVRVSYVGSDIAD